MIKTDDELKIAQEHVARIEDMLLGARRTHTPAQYAMMSTPYLLELQQRQAEIVACLSAQPAHAAGHSPYEGPKLT